MIILSIDPGFEKVGYAFFDKKERANDCKYLTSGLIKTSRKDELSVRLRSVYETLEEKIKEYKPEKLVMEQLFFFKNQKTVIQVAQSQGIMLLVASLHHIPVTFLTPPQIKQMITGYGTSDKKSVEKMLGLLIKENITYEDDDQADAVACGLAYCYLREDLL